MVVSGPAGRITITAVISLAITCLLCSQRLGSTLPARDLVGNSTEWLPAASTAASALPAETSFDASSDEVTAGHDPDAPVDLYGNEVTDAIAKYKFDADGSLYELHSPRTELPRLSSKKS